MNGWAHKLSPRIRTNLFEMLDVNSSWEDLRPCIFRYDGTPFSHAELAGATCSKDLLNDIWFTELITVSQVVQSLRKANLYQAVNFLVEECKEQSNGEQINGTQSNSEQINRNQSNGEQINCTQSNGTLINDSQSNDAEGTTSHKNITNEPLLYNENKSTKRSLPSTSICDQSFQPHFHRDFKYDELRQATGQFSEKHLKGKGGSAMVYFAYLNLHQSKEQLTQVAVKRFHENLKMTPQVYRMYTQEIAALSHKHLLRLIGSSCDKEKEPLLVIEFMSQGTVREHLSLKRKSQTLNALLRCEIAVQVSDALAYLHEKQIVHQDIKCANILLNENFQAKLSDFGSAVKLSNNEVTKIAFTYTPGFIAPEYEQNVELELSNSMDVFSFGVTLLELLTSFEALITENQWIKLMEEYPPNDCRDVSIWGNQHFRPYGRSGQIRLSLYEIALYDTFDKNFLRDDTLKWEVKSKQFELKNVDLFQEIFTIAKSCLNKSIIFRPSSQSVHASLSKLYYDNF